MAEGRASVAKHPIHPMLVVFPIGLWVAALAFDIVAAVTAIRCGGRSPSGTSSAASSARSWPRCRDFSTTPAGRAGPGVSPPGTWSSIWPRSRCSRSMPSSGSASTRTRPGRCVLSVVGVVGVFVSGWLGGELVYVERFGVVEPKGAREDRPRRAA